MIKVMITFQKNRENSGPYQSHKRIMESSLNERYQFEPLWLNGERIGLLNIKLLKSLVRQIKAFDPDLIHVHGLQLAGFYSVLAAKMCKKKTLLVIRGSSLEAISLSPIKRIILGLLERITLKKTSAFYCVSNYVASWDLLKPYKGKSLGTIYNLSFSSKVGDSFKMGIKGQHRINESDIVISCSGRITKEKGFDILCDIILHYQDHCSIKFFIMGTGEYLNEMKEKTESSHCSNVFYTGYTSQVQSYLLISDLFLICTRHETFCNSIIEAQYCGVPVVASRVGGIPEIIEDGFNGFLCDIDKDDFIAKLDVLLSDKELRTQFSQNSIQRFNQKFNEDTIVSQIGNAYMSVLR